MKVWKLYSILLIIAAACSTDNNPEYLPKASGKPGDVLIVMDSVQWNGDLGKEVRKVFAAPVPGLPQSEPMFNIIHIHPGNHTLLSQLRNVVYVFTLDQKTSGSNRLKRRFTDETINKIRTDTSFHLSTRADEHARNQQVMYLFGKNQDQLKLYLQKQKQNIIDYFNKMERDRMLAEYPKTAAGPSKFLLREQKCNLVVPSTYKLAEKTKDFAWFRLIGPNSDRDIFITWKPYVSEYQLLPDSLIEWRNQTLKKYVFEDPEKPDSYLITEREDVKVQARQVTFNNRFSMELRGLWKTNNQTMGGPFISYTVVDEGAGMVYYLEGFVYNPGRDKREMLREVETILWTFKTSDELKSVKTTVKK